MYLSSSDLLDMADTLQQATKQAIKLEGKGYNAEIATIRHAYGEQILRDAIEARDNGAESMSRAILRAYVLNDQGTAYLQKKKGAQVSYMDETTDEWIKATTEEGAPICYKTPREWLARPDFSPAMAEIIQGLIRADINLQKGF